jgi:Tfp pilus assembly protein PilX
MNGHRQKQSGVALIIGLLMLLLLTIIMISAVQVTALEHRMVSNMQTQNVAFQAAETALRQAEALIDSGVTDFNPLRLYGFANDEAVPFRKTAEMSCTNGLCTRKIGAFIVPGEFPDVSEGDMRVATTNLPTINREPVYLIELVATEYSVHSGRVFATFRISARAWAGDNSVVQLQSTYRLHALSIL